MKQRPVIVGGGPAGMGAAIELAKHGVNSILLDEAPRLGGVVYRGPLRQGVVMDYLGRRYVNAMQELHQDFARIANNVDVHLNSRVLGTEANQRLHVLDSQEQLISIDYQHLLLSTGCHERNVPFPGWTLPGVMLLGGLQLQIKSGVVNPLGRTVIAGTGPLLPLVACQLHRAGAEIVGVYEASAFNRIARSTLSLLNQPQLLLDGLSMIAYLKRHHIPLHFGWGIVSAEGQSELQQVTLAPYDENWQIDYLQKQQVSAETLAVGYGFIPRTQLTQLMDLQHQYHKDGYLQPCHNDWQQSSQPHIHLAGDISGLRGSEAAILSGKIAALSILRQRGDLTEAQAEHQRMVYQRKLNAILRFRVGIDAFIRPGMGQLGLQQADTVICRCENVTRKDIDRALDQGIQDILSLKIRTRVGMGDCQGKMCVGYCSDRLREYTGKHDVKWIRPRFPIDPLPFSALNSDLIVINSPEKANHE